MYAANSSAVASATGPPSLACYQVNKITCPTGSLTLSANGTPVDGGTYTLNNEGYTRDIAPTLTGGTYPLVAKYAGDNSYTASTSATDTFTVTQAATTILSSNPPMPPQSATPFDVSVILTTKVFGVMPSCNFTFYDGTTALPGTAICQWQRNGPFSSRSFPLSQTTSGAHTYTAKFAGDSNYAPSASAAISTKVFFGTTATLSAD